MSFTPLETVSIIECLENFVEMLRPKDENIKKKLDYGYKVEGYTVFITEIRPQWDNPEIINEHAFAKATFVKSREHWKIFWMRANLKWYAYDPVPIVKKIDDFVNVVGEDAHHCFFG